MDHEALKSEMKCTPHSAGSWQRLVRKTMLPWIGACLCLACTHSQSSNRGATDAADVRPNLWPDASWTIDGACGDNPNDLMQVLATSLGSSFCSRTASNQPEGYIYFDGEGRVTSISGYRVPADKQAWVDSLAAYRWPCLAGQTIAYGCS